MKCTRLFFKLFFFYISNKIKPLMYSINIQVQKIFLTIYFSSKIHLCTQYGYNITVREITNKICFVSLSFTLQRPWCFCKIINCKFKIVGNNRHRLLVPRKLTRFGNNNKLLQHIHMYFIIYVYNVFENFWSHNQRRHPVMNRIQRQSFTQYYHRLGENK